MPSSLIEARVEPTPFWTVVHGEVWKVYGTIKGRRDLDSSPFHNGSASLLDAVMGPMDNFVIGLNHGSEFELAVPDPLYNYLYRGPMDNVALDLVMDGRGEVRACFFRSGNLVVY